MYLYIQTFHKCYVIKIAFVFCVRIIYNVIFLGKSFTSRLLTGRAYYIHDGCILQNALTTQENKLLELISLLPPPNYFRLPLDKHKDSRALVIIKI